MTKNKSEFSKTLDNLEKEISELNAQKKVVIDKDKRIQKVLNDHEAKLTQLKNNEELILKKMALRNQLMFYFILSVLGILFLPAIYNRDPVNFWFGIAVIICIVGIKAAKR
jgi:hypothetical protein